ncbi:beta-lactamase family protein [Maribacter sp.]|nr:beta-lactamase family protein [Maribacter sp.]
MKQLGITLVLLIAVTITSKAQSAEAKLNQKLDSISKQYGLAGFGVSVFTADSVLYEKGYGFADLENKKPYTINSVQNIGSISKTFIGVSLMKAEELGKLAMETPINDILPFKVIHPNHPEVAITVEHLATHTSGIIDFEKSYDKTYVLENPSAVQLDMYDAKMAKEMKHLLGNKSMALDTYLKAYLSKEGALYSKKNFQKSRPGEKYTYSNIGAALAAYCIEVVTGKSFPEFTQQYIFDVVGMKNSGWSYGTITMENHAQTYSNNLKPLPRYSLVTYPDGGLRTSITDLTKYMQAMIGCYDGKGEVLKKESCSKMMKGHLTAEHYASKELDENYGYFWESNQHKIIGHNGGDPGIVTLMYYYKDLEMAGIFFTNTNAIGNRKATKQIQAAWKAIRNYQKQKATQI